jgi:hypothetical protein
MNENGEPATPHSTRISFAEEPDRVAKRHESFVRWQRSDDRRRWFRSLWIVIGVTAVWAAGTPFLVYISAPSGWGGVELGQSPFLIPVVTVSILGGFGATIALLYSYQRARRLVWSEAWREEARALSDAEESLAAAGAELDLGALWAVNQQRIEYYHWLAQSQSRVSFQNASIASVAGLMLLIAAGAFAAFAPSVPAAIASGAVGVAGAAMSGFIGSTFIRMQGVATRQMGEFFLQPVEFSRLLGAERLLAMLPDADRAAAVQVILRAALRSDDRSADSAERT